jgi:sigma-B regulation protein RsbU (phosphoserine phosphatase)
VSDPGGIDAVLVDQIEVAVIAVSLDSTVLRWNRHAEKMFGWTAAEMVGKKATEIATNPLDPATASEIAKRLDAGETWEGDFTVKHKDGSTTVVHAIDSSLRDERGALVGVVSVVVDVTDRHQADEQRATLLASEQAARAQFEQRQAPLEFLAAASRRLNASLDLDTTAGTLAALAVPYLAGACAVDVLEPGSMVRRAAAVGLAHDERVGASALGDGPVAEVLRTAQPFVVEGPPDGPLVVLPLVARGRQVGALTLVPDERGAAGTDLGLAAELAYRGALAIDNARVFADHALIARSLQDSLLPPRPPEIPGIEFAARYRAAGEGLDVGGDFYDAFALGYGSWAVAIGDVCGRGPQAAALTGLVRHTIRALAMQERQPSKILAMLNEALQEQATADNSFCTVCLLRLRTRPSGVRLTMCSGGHPLPLVLRARGDVVSVGRPGTVLGVLPSPALADATVDLEVGDALVLYTDGVTEARRRTGRIFGEYGLRRVVESATKLDAATIAARIEDAAVSFVGGRPDDDVAVVVLRVLGSTPR